MRCAVAILGVLCFGAVYFNWILFKTFQEENNLIRINQFIVVYHSI